MAEKKTKKTGTKQKKSKKVPMYLLIKDIEGYMRKTGRWVKKHEKLVQLGLAGMAQMAAFFIYYRQLVKQQVTLSNEMTKLSTKNTQYAKRVQELDEKTIKSIEQLAQRLRENEQKLDAIVTAPGFMEWLEKAHGVSAVKKITRRQAAMRAANKIASRNK